jgi:ketosteroid isomerase-like protein
MSQVEIVRRVYEAGVAQDLEEMLDLADAACVITQDPSLPWGGRHVGHQGLTAFLSALFGTIDSEVSTEALFEADGHVISAVGQGCGAGERDDLRVARGAHLDGQEQQGRRRAFRYRHAGDASGG